MRFTVVALALIIATGPGWATPNVSFTISVLLSAKAAKEMEFTGQSLAVDAVYYGNPNKVSVRKADNSGRIDLGEERTTLSGIGGIATIIGRQFKLQNLQFIAGAPQVNVNIFSMTNGKPSNILDCEIIDGNIPRPDEEMTRLHCKLIDER